MAACLFFLPISLLQRKKRHIVSGLHISLLEAKAGGNCGDGDHTRAKEARTLSAHFPKRGFFLPGNSKPSRPVSLSTPNLDLPHPWFCDFSHYLYPFPVFSL